MERDATIDKKHEELFRYLESQREDENSKISEDIKAEGLTLRVGTKLLKFELSREESLPVDDIKLDMHKQYCEKLDAVKSYLEKNLMESYQAIEGFKTEAENKKREYERLIKDSRPVPEISFKTTKAGLSVCKDDGRGLIWLYRGIYAPKYFYKETGGERAYISPKHFKELITPVMIQVRTTGDRITSVNVLNIFGNKFKHYHDTGGDDCWGGWKPSTESYNNPEDILAIGIKALNILETINESSPGTQNPTDLPRMSTIRNGLMDEIRPEDYDSKQSQIYKRMGLANVKYDVMEIKRHSSGGGWTI